jgi:hypothetical protein
VYRSKHEGRQLYRHCDTYCTDTLPCWHEGADEFGAYNWNEVNESLRFYKQLSGASPISCLCSINNLWHLTCSHMNLRLRPASPSSLVAPIPLKSWALRLSRSSTSSEKAKVSLPVSKYLRAPESSVRSHYSRLVYTLYALIVDLH